MNKDDFKISVLGIGGAGINIVNYLVQTGIKDVNFIVADTDEKALSQTLVKNKIKLGTKNLNAEANLADVKQLVLDAKWEFMSALRGTKLVFIITGMGGKIGTETASFVVKIAKKRKILTMGIAIKPFIFEGEKRMKIAQNGIKDFCTNVDNLVVFSNQDLLTDPLNNTTFSDVFERINKTIKSIICSVPDLIMY